MNILKNKLHKNTLILASGSPRRQELLKGLDIPFIVETKEIEEHYPSHLEGAEITEYLACLKATSFMDLSEDTILLTADTIVWLDKKALMKPKDRVEAVELLRQLSGKSHEVFTAVCLKSKHKKRVFSDVTKVFIKPLTEEEISYYIDHYQPFDKAGAYGAQDWIGYVAIQKLEGSYFNVLGLPVHKLYQELLTF